MADEKFGFVELPVPPLGRLPHPLYALQPPSNRLGAHPACVQGDPDVNAAPGTCVTDGETSLRVPALPAHGPIVPASDEEIAGWLCGGRDGGCEDWPECEYCRMVARIEADRATIAKQAEEIERLRSALINLRAKCLEMGWGPEAPQLLDASAALSKPEPGR